MALVFDVRPDRIAHDVRRQARVGRVGDRDDDMQRLVVRNLVGRVEQSRGVRADLFWQLFQHLRTFCGLVGLMQTVGNVVGYGLVVLCASALIRNPGLALGIIAVIELATMASVVFRVGNGPAPKPREGRSWATIARETRGTDILRERSYVWLLISRLVFLTAGSIPFAYVVTFLKQTLGYDETTVTTPNFVVLGTVAITTAIAVVPAARLSDRVGRKTVIYGACAIGAIGLGLASAAPGFALLAVGGALWGSASGAFLAVDWALMTDIIPRASAGRYMGLSNVATASSAVFTTGAASNPAASQNRDTAFQSDITITLDSFHQSAIRPPEPGAPVRLMFGADDLLVLGED